MGMKNILLALISLVLLSGTATGQVRFTYYHWPAQGTVIADSKPWSYHECSARIGKMPNNEVRAARRGKVKEAKSVFLKSINMPFGYIIIDNDNGYETMYSGAWLIPTVPTVLTGQYVVQDQKIAFFAAPASLHFRISRYGTKLLVPGSFLGKVVGHRERIYGNFPDLRPSLYEPAYHLDGSSSSGYIRTSVNTVATATPNGMILDYLEPFWKIGDVYDSKNGWLLVRYAWDPYRRCDKYGWIKWDHLISCHTRDIIAYSLLPFPPTY